MARSSVRLPHKHNKYHVFIETSKQRFHAWNIYILFSIEIKKIK
jgi:hypothetical protein